MAASYQIRVRGHLGADWSDWFEGLTISYEAETGLTSLAGPLSDQSALLGVLIRLNNLNLELLSLNRMEEEKVKSNRQNVKRDS